MPTNHGHIHITHRHTSLFSVECLGTHNIQGGDAEHALGVIDTLLFEDFSSNGHSGVDWVGDDVEQCLGAVLAACSDEVTHNACINLCEYKRRGEGGLSSGLYCIPSSSVTLNKSSRVMPGLRGTPAGMMTTSAPLSAAARFSSPSV